MLWLKCGRSLSELQNDPDSAHRNITVHCYRCNQPIKILRKLEFNLSFQKSRVILMKTDERSV